MLAGILEENRENSAVAAEVEVRDSEESDSDEDSYCDVECSVYFNPDDSDSDCSYNKEIETNFMSGNWKWEAWEPQGDEDAIEGPLEEDHYNGPHGLRPGVANQFKTILQCIFATTAMNKSFFRD